MTDEKPTGSSNPNPDEQKPEYHSWRDERRAWRHERRERRWQQPLHGLFWGLLLIVLGVLFLASQQGWLTGEDWWHYLLIGLGVVFIIDGLAHFVASDRHYSFGRFIPGIILLFVGLAFVYGFSEWWPVVLIAVGVGILLSFVFRRF